MILTFFIWSIGIVGIHCVWQELSPNFEFIEKLVENRKQNKDECPKLAPPVAIDPSTYGPWTSAPVKSIHDRLFRSTFNLLLDKGLFFNERAGNGRNTPPFNYTSPEILQNLVNFTLPHDPESIENLLGYLEQLIELSPHLSHPYYLKKSSGLDPFGLAADFLTSFMNSVTVLYLCGPVYTLMEIEMMKNIRVLAYGEQYMNVSKGDGILSPFPNAFAVQIALQKKYPMYKKSGYFGLPQVAIFTSDQGDYTTLKASFFEGLGLASVYLVKSDQFGRMNMKELEMSIEKAKKQDREPLLIIGTAGTPILGGIDNLEEISKIAHKNKIYFHVDASCGGGLLLSESKRSFLQGIESSDSFSWSPTCLLGVPFSSNMILTRDDLIFQTVFGVNSTTVYKNNSLHSSKYDLGDRTTQTSRRPEIFKLWTMFKVKGRSGLANHIDYIFSLTEFTMRELRNRGDRFQLILEYFDLPFISFYFIPQGYRKFHKNSQEFIEKINKFIDRLKTELLARNLLHLSISSGVGQKSPNFFTINLSNSALYTRDIIYILDVIEYVGNELLSGRNNKIPPRPPLPPRSYPQFISAPVDSEHRKLFRGLFDLILEQGLYFQDKRSEPALNFRTPEKLREEFDFSVLVNGTTNSEFLKTDEILQIFKGVIKYSPHQSHSYWIYQLLAGLDPYGILADLVLSSVTSPQLAYEDNPISNLAEKEVYSKLLAKLHWPNGYGLSVPGGSISNIYAVFLALNSKFPQLKHSGLRGEKKLVMYISIDAHYSYNKGAYFTGIGLDNCILIGTDSNGRMNTTELRLMIEKTLAEGGQPFFVGASAGTTILGAFDNLTEIGTICKEYNLFFHVDGAFGGSLIMSNSHIRTEKLKGVEMADSFTFNPTKIYGATISLTCFLVKNKTLVQSSFGLNHSIDFDFKSSTLYDREKWDLGDSNLQISRSSIFKFWFMWKAKGSSNMAKHIEIIYSNTQYCVEEMLKRPGFVPFLENFELTNVVFMYVPETLRDLDRSSQDFKTKMDKVGTEIQSKLILDGIMVIVAQNEQDSTLNLKFVLMSSALTKEDIKYLISSVEKYGNEWKDPATFKE